MKSGLEEFLKRIEVKPTNETLIDRFMTLVLEEDGVERILYLKSLVGLLLKSNPYAALKAAYVELQEARKEKLSNEYEIGALKDVESCFLNLGKNDNAALVREEIMKLSAESTMIQSMQKPSAPRPIANPRLNHDQGEFPMIPGDDDNIPGIATGERTRMAPPPAQHTVMTDMAKTFESPTAKPFEKKPIPNFPSESKAAAPAPKGKPLPAPMTPASPPEDLNADVVNSAMFQPKGANLDPGFANAAHDRTRATPIQIPSSKPSSTSIPLESSFPEEGMSSINSDSAAEADNEGEDGFGFSFEYTKRGPVASGDNELGSIGTVSDAANDAANGTMDRDGANAKSRTIQTGFSLKDDIGDGEISVSAEIDESFENQPFFQPDDDDDDTPPPAERTILISLEKLDESKEQIDLAAGSSASVKNVKYPVNSGPNFVVLDSDDDETATDLPAAEPLPTDDDPGASPGTDEYASAAFDPDALPDQNYSPGAPFVYDPEPIQAADSPRSTQTPFNLEADFPFVQDAPPAAEASPTSTFTPSTAPFAMGHEPVLTYTGEATPAPFSIAEDDPAPLDMDEAIAAPFIAKPSPTIVQESQASINMTVAPGISPIHTQPAAQSTQMQPPQASPVVQAAQTTQPPQASPVITHMPQPSPHYAQASVPMHNKVEIEPQVIEGFEITPQPFIDSTPPHSLEMSVDEAEDTDVAYRYKDAAESKHISDDDFDDEPVKPHLIPTPNIVTKWTVVQERLKLFSGLQIGRSHAVDFVKRLLNAKTETPVVLKTLNLLLQFVEARLDKALCTKMAAWLFEELNPAAMHQLWDSLNLKDEGLELFLDYISDLEKTNQHRRSLSIMHDILRFELEMNWYVDSYPHLIHAWEKLGLDGWIWLEEEGPGVFCDRLARREDPMLATLLI